MIYFLPWQHQTLTATFDARDYGSGVPGAEPPKLGVKPPELGAKPPESDTKPPELATYHDWNAIPADLQQALLTWAAPVARRRKTSAEILRATIRTLCTGRFLGLRVLAHVLQRDADDLRKRTLTPMVQEGALLPAFASTRDPRQAYTAAVTDTTRLDT